MPLVDQFFALPAIRKAIWKLWYPYLTRRLKGENVLFLNYAFDTHPTSTLPLDVADEPNRACIQLYHHVATQVDLSGKEVLEVSCGHGGGASWIARYQHPSSYVGLDLNPEGVKFCAAHHQVPGLSFIQGDAQHLPFGDASLDAVVNVEASHCYPDFTGFLAEVARVLRPQGHFLYADFRFREDVPTWEKDIASAPLEVVRSQNISSHVLLGMDCNAERSLSLVHERLPKFLHSLGRDFAGVPGSRIYEALKNGDLEYRSWCFRKAP